MQSGFMLESFLRSVVSLMPLYERRPSFTNLLRSSFWLNVYMHTLHGIHVGFCCKLLRIFLNSRFPFNFKHSIIALLSLLLPIGKTAFSIVQNRTRNGQPKTNFEGLHLVGIRYAIDCFALKDKPTVDSRNLAN